MPLRLLLNNVNTFFNGVSKKLKFVPMNIHPQNSDDKYAIMTLLLKADTKHPSEHKAMMVKNKPMYPDIILRISNCTK